MKPLELVAPAASGRYEFRLPTLSRKVESNVAVRAIAWAVGTDPEEVEAHRLALAARDELLRQRIAAAYGSRDALLQDATSAGERGGWFAVAMRLGVGPSAVMGAFREITPDGPGER
jgi:hypothetical protein